MMEKSTYSKFALYRETQKCRNVSQKMEQIENYKLDVCKQLTVNHPSFYKYTLLFLRMYIYVCHILAL